MEEVEEVKRKREYASVVSMITMRANNFFSEIANTTQSLRNFLKLVVENAASNGTPLSDELCDSSGNKQELIDKINNIRDVLGGWMKLREIASISRRQPKRE